MKQTKKVYYFGYMIHRLLMAVLHPRLELDDRNRYANKRTDLLWLIYFGTS